MAKKNRTDTEILKELIDEIMEYNSLRDEEWEFEDRTGGNRDMWSEEDMEEHDELLDEIQKHRVAIRNLIVEATGDENLSF